MRKWLHAIGIGILSACFIYTLQAQEFEQTSHSTDFNTLPTLDSGVWYKVRTAQEGIHQISFSKLEELGFSNPGQVMVFTGFHGMLPEKVDSGSLDGLYSVPVVYRESHILFYAHNTDKWRYDEAKSMFRVKPHVYSKFNTYFLYQADSEEELHKAQKQEVFPEDPASRTFFTDYTYHEENDTNLIKSGREWYGEKFDAQTSYQFNFPMPHLVSGSEIRVWGSAIARSPEASSFSFQAGGHTVSLVIGPVSYAHTAAVANRGDVHFSANAPEGDAINVKITYNKSSVASEGWLEKIIVNARRRLRMEDKSLQFTNLVPEDADGIHYTLSNIPENLVVWNITHPRNIYSMDVNRMHDEAGFSVKDTSRWVRMIAFNPAASYPEPAYTGIFTGEVAHQDIHGDETPQLVIVSAPEFIEQARQLRDFHQAHNGLNSAVYLVNAVYNEFSGGKPDAAAIRNMLRMFYIRETQKPLRYLVLFGDGSYDNFTYSNRNTNFLPTYQSKNSLAPTGSFVTDDFFGLLDIGEGGASGELDIGIGRLPVQTQEEAEVVLKKIKDYKNNMKHGLWRNKLCFAGDDEDGNLFMHQANELANQVENRYEGFISKKIFLDAYQQKTTSSREVYPGATRDLNDLVQNGVLMVNYVGHGAEDKLAEENLLQMSDIRSWTNDDRLTVFITATCEFSRFDNYAGTSAGEEALLNPNGGAAALFSTTRLVWAGENYNLNQKFINHVFQHDSTINSLRLGDIIRKTKIDAGSSYNKRNFMLLGDPVLKLAHAEHKVVTDTVNNQPATIADTVGAMEFVEIKGSINHQSGGFMADFNGIVYISLYDKAVTTRTLANDDNEPFEFRNRDNLLYKGKASVSEGRFTIGFYVPKDIHYQTGTSKISYYAVDTVTNTNARGEYKNMLIGGTAANPVADSRPPEIKLYLNSPDFSCGDIVNKNPVLVAEISDDTGINTTSGIGHGISMRIDSAYENMILLNDYYEASLDNYRSGKVTYKLNDLSEGIHTISLKAWDIANKSAEESIRFKVIGAENPRLTQLKNLPNPFHDRTRFYFKHNLTGTPVKVQLRIYDRHGRVVRIFRKSLSPEVYYNSSITWDGTDAGGSTVPDGIYFYKLLLKNEMGQSVSKSGKLLFLHKK